MTKKSFPREAAELVLAFFIAWLAFQALAAVTGTPMPIVSVVSDSMYHTSHFDSWWDENGRLYAEYNINKTGFMHLIAPNGLSRGDLLFVTKPENPKTGDILIYNKLGSGFTIVHRLVKEGDGFYIVKGDNNKIADPPVAKRFVVGKVVFAVPILGYPRFLLHEIGI